MLRVISRLLGTPAAPPTVPSDKKSKWTLLQDKISNRAKPDAVEEAILDHPQVGPHDFKYNELGDDHRVTKGWDDSQYWTLNRVIFHMIPSDPAITAIQARQNFESALKLLEEGSPRRWKLIRARQSPSHNVTIPTGLNPVDQRRWLYDHDMWKKGYVVPIDPGEHGYDDPDTLQIPVALNKRDWRNIMQYDQGWRHITGAISPDLDKGTPIKSEDLSKNSVGNPSTGPMMRGISAVFEVMGGDAAKSIDTLAKTVFKSGAGALASLKDIRSAVEKGDLMGPGDTIYKSLVERAHKAETDPLKGIDQAAVDARIASGLRFLGFDSPAGTTDDPEAPDLDQTLGLRIKLGELLQKMGHGHEVVNTPWGRTQITALLYQRNPDGSLILQNGRPVPVIRDGEEVLVVTRRAFSTLEFYQLAQWAIHAQKSSFAATKRSFFGFFHKGERSKYPLLPDFTVLSMAAGVITLVVLAVVLHADLTATIILTLGAMFAVTFLTKVEDPEHMTTGEEWRTVVTLMLIGSIGFGAINWHRVDQESTASVNRAAYQKDMVDRGLLTQADLDRVNNIKAQIVAEQEQLKQHTGAPNTLSTQNSVLIVVLVFVIMLAVLFYSQWRRRSYHPVRDRHARWRRPLI